MKRNSERKRILKKRYIEKFNRINNASDEYKLKLIMEDYNNFFYIETPTNKMRELYTLIKSYKKI